MALEMLVFVVLISRYMAQADPCVAHVPMVDVIQSPGYPSTRPYGYYTCMYHMTNDHVDGQVQLVFDDFFIFGSFYENKCDDDKDILKIYDGANSSDPLLGVFCLAMKRRPPAILSTGPDLYVEYSVRSTDQPEGFPGFKAHYSFIKSNATHYQLPAVETFIFFQNGDGLIHFPIGGKQGKVDVVWLFIAGQTNKQIYLHLDSIFKTLGPVQDKYSWQLQVLDGISSSSSVLLNMSLSDAYKFQGLHINTSSHYMYMRLKSDSLFNTPGVINAVFSFFLNTGDGGYCSDFKCDDGWCIQSMLICDHRSHCADGSDEKYCKEPCIGCKRGTDCDNRGRCLCPHGYYGPYCTERCHESYCANGGTCRDTIYVSPYCLCQDGYDGPMCEFTKRKVIDGSVASNQCPQNKCYNGGTCYQTQDDYYCACPELYSGEFCIQNKEDSIINHNMYNNKFPYLCSVLIPLFLLIVCGLLYKYKRNIPRRADPNAVINTSPWRHQFGSDHPPSYEQVMIGPSASPLTWQQGVEMVEFIYEEAPPKYEDVMVDVETRATQLNGSQQNLDRSRPYNVHKTS